MGTTLVLHGVVNLQTVPQLKGVLDGVLSLHPLFLVVDFSQATSVGEDALEAVAAREADVPALTVRLPGSVGRSAGMPSAMA